jgi:hypothetical protein
MEIGWLWFALACAWLVNLLLLRWALRLRLEVWANRRVIAALEAAAHNSAQKSKQNRTLAVSLMLFLVVLGQLLMILKEFWL